MGPEIVLLRHTEVAGRWRGRCYGRLDVGLSRAGGHAAKALVERLAAERIDAIIHSGARRTRAIAEPLARALGLRALCDPRWLERDFGDWEGRSWQAIYRDTGNAMDGMIDDPGGYRPGGGETTLELRDRVMSGWQDMPAGRCLVVTHGGPIAALRGTLDQRDVGDWPVGACNYGEVVRLTLHSM